MFEEPFKIKFSLRQANCDKHVSCPILVLAKESTLLLQTLSKIIVTSRDNQLAKILSQHKIISKFLYVMHQMQANCYKTCKIPILVLAKEKALLLQSLSKIIVTT